MDISRLSLKMLAVATVMMAALSLSGCGGGTTATTTNSTGKSALSGDITFPDDAVTTAKTTAKTVGLATGTVLVDVFTLDNTKVKSGITTTWNETTKSYSYSVSDLTPGVDYLIRAVKTKADRSKLTLKKLVEKVNVTEGSNKGLAVDTSTTTIVTVVEKKLYDADNTMKVKLGEDNFPLPAVVANASALSKKINDVVGSVQAFESQLKGITDSKGIIVAENISGAATANLKLLLADLATLLSQVKAAVQASIDTHDLIVEKKEAAISAAAVIPGTISQYKADGTSTPVKVSEIKTGSSINTYTPSATTTPSTSASGSASITAKVFDYNNSTSTSTTGVPMAGVTVTTIGLSPAITTTTDTTGSFVLAGIPLNTPFSVKVSKTTYADTYSHTFSLKENMDISSRPYALFLPDKLNKWKNTAGYGVIRNRVVANTNLDNGFIGGAVVTATDQVDGKTYKVDYIDATGGISGTLNNTDPASGQFNIVNIPAGHTVNVTATKAGFTFNTRTFTVQADASSQARIVGTASSTVSSSNVFTKEMLSGKTFTEGQTNKVVFGTDGTFTMSDPTPGVRTWSINSSGQLVVLNSTDGSSTIVTLVSGNLTDGLTITLAHSDGTTELSTITLKP